MRFTYPANLEQYSEDEIVVSFRDLPECLTSGEDETEALLEAEDALEEAVAGRMDDGEPIPAPSAPLPGEHMVALPIDMAAKAALVLVFRDRGLTQTALAERLGVDRKVVQRMLDPGTALPSVASTTLCEPWEARSFWRPPRCQLRRKDSARAGTPVSRLLQSQSL